MLAQAWLAGARARRRLARARGRRPPREALVAAHVRGKTFADVGCMWGVDGAIAFAAETAGAAAVTGVDLMPATPTYERVHAERHSRVRFVQGDLHDPAAIAAIGAHDVVWCSGVVYHAPHPLLTLERLRELTGELLILSSETIPEVPGIAQACVFLPGLPERHRRAYAAARGGRDAHGITTEFDPEQGYGNWYWGLSPSALAAMCAASGFLPIHVQGDQLHTTILARPLPAPLVA
jgi:2-polyprenyl-3-methyl-5-hydroxy-6-metoxy-1,4-benzoquinol methylase